MCFHIFTHIFPSHSLNSCFGVYILFTLSYPCFFLFLFVQRVVWVVTPSKTLYSVLDQSNFVILLFPGYNNQLYFMICSYWVQTIDLQTFNLFFSTLSCIKFPSHSIQGLFGNHCIGTFLFQSYLLLSAQGFVLQSQCIVREPSIIMFSFFGI